VQPADFDIVSASSAFMAAAGDGVILVALEVTGKNELMAMFLPRSNQARQMYVGTSMRGWRNADDGALKLGEMARQRVR